MAYADADTVKSRAPATLEKEQYVGQIQKGIKWADTWIDSRLRSKFPERLPFKNPTPDQIQEIAADLAASYVLKAAFAGGGEAKTPTQAQDLFDRAQLALDLIISGDMSLPLTPEETAKTPSLGIYSSTYGVKGALADFDLVNQPLGHRGVPLAPYKRWDW